MDEKIERTGKHKEKRIIPIRVWIILIGIFYLFAHNLFGGYETRMITDGKDKLLKEINSK